MKDIEIGPIRPPSESNSLLIRVTRGCHWNKCYFCGLYKSMRFSMRPIDETIEDIRRQAQLNRGKKITSCFLQDGDAETEKTAELMDNVSKLYEELISFSDLYDSASFEAKKMIVNQLIRRVDVYRGYQISVSFNFNLSQYFEGIDTAAC